MSLYYIQGRKSRRLLLVHARTLRCDISRANVFNVLTASRNRFRPRRVSGYADTPVSRREDRRDDRRPRGRSGGIRAYRQVRVTSPSWRYLKVTESRTERKARHRKVDLDNDDYERVSKREELYESRYGSRSRGSG